ncbi:hypothetical protein, partial [Neisseria sp. HMSC077D05]|uniref:hypothetical protein n=1 Tax=Neisseria sp. HMSC077D05 TaxID=1715079 RepID=UPI001AEF89AB
YGSSYIQGWVETQQNLFIPTFCQVYQPNLTLPSARNVGFAHKKTKTAAHLAAIPKYIQESYIAYRVSD